VTLNVKRNLYLTLNLPLSLTTKMTSWWWLLVVVTGIASAKNETRVFKMGLLSRWVLTWLCGVQDGSVVKMGLDMAMRSSRWVC